MSKKPDGGPAFPNMPEICHGNEGMSLRDWFAGQAVVGMMAAKVAQATSNTAAQILAKSAYLLADAMLAEREK